MASDFASVYDIGRKLGQGSFGNVHLVMSRKDGQTYALKVVELSARHITFDDVEKEVNVMSALEHPNILKMIHALKSSASGEVLRVGIVLEFCSEGDMSVYIRRRFGKLMDRERLRSWMGQLSSAVSYIHGKNIMHRDMKPANIFINQEQDLKLGDFGIAKVLLSSYAGTAIGTPAFMAPETFHGLYGLEADVYSLGCVFLCMAILKPMPKNVKGEFYTLPPETMYGRDVNTLIISCIHSDKRKRPTAQDIDKCLTPSQLILQNIPQSPISKRPIPAACGAVRYMPVKELVAAQEHFSPPNKQVLPAANKPSFAYAHSPRKLSNHVNNPVKPEDKYPFAMNAGKNLKSPSSPVNGNKLADDKFGFASPVKISRPVGVPLSPQPSPSPEFANKPQEVKHLQKLPLVFLARKLSVENECRVSGAKDIKFEPNKESHVPEVKEENMSTLAVKSDTTNEKERPSDKRIIVGERLDLTKLQISRRKSSTSDVVSESKVVAKQASPAGKITPPLKDKPDNQKGIKEFHTVHGKAIVLSKRNQKAKRFQGNNLDGLLFSSRPVNAQEKISFKIKELNFDTDNYLVFGFTAADPNSLQKIPYSIHDLKSRNRTWIVVQGLKSERQLTFHFESSGDIMFRLGNGKDIRFTLEKLDSGVPLWAVIDLQFGVSCISLTRKYDAN